MARYRLRWVAGCCSLVVSVGAVVAPPATANPRAAAGHGVTLITGDRVLVDGDRVLSITPGAGRQQMSFQVFRRDGRLHVLPRDVVRPLADGRLDPKLFDVTGLIDAGYDDARRDTVPVIVSGGDAPAGAREARSLPAARAVAAEVPKNGGWAGIQRLGTGKVWLDAVLRPALDRSTAQVGAPTAWAAALTGTGVTVAVVDTGVDGAHPDLAGREVAERNFSTESDTVDRFGHGTHVAATIASHDAKYRGVAPDARLLDAKVCDVNGRCPASRVIEGLRWAAEQGAQVVNMSLAYPDSEGLDPMEAAIEELSARNGMLFVVSAGNSGARGTLGSPGTTDAALTVGAVERNDTLASFSSRGPRSGDGGIKPDITAPGVDIVAARSAQGHAGTPVDDKHVALSGTSMAAPHVAGAAALLKQQHPDWSGTQLKATLTASARPNSTLTAYEQGSGRLDVAAALDTTLTTDPVSIGTGVEWPHDEDVPVPKRLAYRTSGAEPVTLDLTVATNGPDGKQHNVFSVVPSRVTVPAGGQADVTVTGDPHAATVNGIYSGAVVATGAGRVVRTPVAMNHEPETYRVTFDHLDSGGAPANDYSTTVMSLSGNLMRVVADPDGTGSLRLPAGDYMVMTDFGHDGDQPALLMRPDLHVGSDTRVVLDSRTAKPIRITPPDPAAKPGPQRVDVQRTRNGVTGWSTAYYPSGFPAGLRIAHAGPALPDAEGGVLIAAQFTGTAAHYLLAWPARGRVPTGFVRRPSVSDLTRVRTTFGPTPPGVPTDFYPVAILPPLLSGGLGPIPSTAPVTTYVTPGPGWQWSLFQGNGGFQFSEIQTYRAGHAVEQTFNAPVFGPSMPAEFSPYLSRNDDVITANLPLFSDGAGHYGTSPTASARTALTRDGVLVGENAISGWGEFRVAPGPAAYTLDMAADRAPGISDFSSRVALTWMFRSDTTAGDTRLPLSIVRFTPALSRTGTTPAGRILAVPLVVEQQPGAANRPLRHFTVETSFDDGTSWKTVPVTGRTALVPNPQRPGTFASLRVRATDDHGGELRQTVVRAYRLV
jgi:subtilisin family serine protease